MDSIGYEHAFASNIAYIFEEDGYDKAEKELKEKMFMFDKLGDSCMTCGKPFDKKDREQVQKWNVVVRRKEKKVNLYCPEC
mgnify:CR=1 FL=1